MAESPTRGRAYAGRHGWVTNVCGITNTFAAQRLGEAK